MKLLRSFFLPQNIFNHRICSNWFFYFISDNATYHHIICKWIKWMESLFSEKNWKIPDEICVSPLRSSWDPNKYSCWKVQLLAAPCPPDLEISKQDCVYAYIVISGIIGGNICILICYKFNIKNIIWKKHSLYINDRQREANDSFKLCIVNTRTRGYILKLNQTQHNLQRSWDTASAKGRCFADALTGKGSVFENKRPQLVWYVMIVNLFCDKIA